MILQLLLNIMGGNCNFLWVCRLVAYDVPIKVRKKTWRALYKKGKEFSNPLDFAVVCLILRLQLQKRKIQKLLRHHN